MENFYSDAARHAKYLDIIYRGSTTQEGYQAVQKELLASGATFVIPIGHDGQPGTAIDPANDQGLIYLSQDGTLHVMMRGINSFGEALEAVTDSGFDAAAGGNIAYAGHFFMYRHIQTINDARQRAESILDKPPALFIGGQSFGGAFGAALTSYAIENDWFPPNDPRNGVALYGAPFIGDREFRDVTNKRAEELGVPIVHISHAEDPIPNILQNREPIGRLMTLTDSGQLVEDRRRSRGVSSGNALIQALDWLGEGVAWGTHDPRVMLAALRGEDINRAYEQAVNEDRAAMASTAQGTQDHEATTPIAPRWKQRAAARHE